MVRCRRSDRTSEGKGHHRCLPRIGILVRPGQVACIHRPREILRSSRRLGRGFLAQPLEQVFQGWRQYLEIILVLDVFFNSNPPFFFGERVEAELSELIEFPTIVLGYVIMKDLYKKPFMYSMIGDLVN
ncbi:hypothetical protein Tco_0661912 [Tanacetum coccineum]